MKVEMNAVVLTISDTEASEGREDRVGSVLVDKLREAHINVVEREVIPRDRSLIVQRLRDFAAREGINLILTVGGTGLSPADVTPEATREVIEREVPGIPEVMRVVNWESTPLSIISRAVSGILSSTLIINLPGSVKGVTESFDAIKRVLPHAIGTMTQQTPKCGGR